MMEFVEFMFIIRFEQLRKSSGSFKTINNRNHLNLYKAITLFYAYDEVPNDNAQRQFAYFIAAIYQNTLKSFLSQLL